MTEISKEDLYFEEQDTQIQFSKKTSLYHLSNGWKKRMDIVIYSGINNFVKKLTTCFWEDKKKLQQEDLSSCTIN